AALAAPGVAGTDPRDPPAPRSPPNPLRRTDAHALTPGAAPEAAGRSRLRPTDSRAVDRKREHVGDGVGSQMTHQQTIEPECDPRAGRKSVRHGGQQAAPLRERLDAVGAAMFVFP